MCTVRSFCTIATNIRYCDHFWPLYVQHVIGSSLNKIDLEQNVAICSNFSEIKIILKYLITFQTGLLRYCGRIFPVIVNIGTVGDRTGKR